MPTTKELVADVEAELNAVKAADMGMQAVKAFVQQAQAAFTEGDVIVTKQSLDHLASLVEGLIPAIPANVVPASAGPVGKSPHEQYLEQAKAIVEDSLAKMSEALKGVNQVLAGVHEATNHAIQATAAIQSPDLKAGK